MKALLVGINSKFIHSNLAIRYLKAYTENLHFESKIKEFSINELKEKIVTDIIAENASIVAFSCYIWNIEYVKSISRTLKLIDEDIDIIYGGPEVSYDSEVYLKEGLCDFLIEEEGEETFKEFINAYLENSSKEKIAKEKIKGLYSRFEDNIFFGGKRDNIDMSSLIFPYKYEIPENKIIYYESSRGCPFSCSYCMSSVSRGVRFLDFDRVKLELKYLCDNGVKLIKFVDRTFNCNSEYTYKLWKYIIELETDTVFHFEISADLINEEQLELLKSAKSGRMQFEIGVQTTNEEILKNISRNSSYSEIMDRVLRISKMNTIKEHLDLIAGLPGEDINSFIASFNDIYSLTPEEIQLGFLKVLKGSPLSYEKDKWGIVYLPYPPYEILKSNSIKYQDIVRLKRIEEVLDRYYNSHRFPLEMDFLVKIYSNPFEFYEKLSNYFKQKGLFDISISSKDYYRVLTEYYTEFIHEDINSFKELVKYDYLLNNKKSYLPEFLNRFNDKKTTNFIKNKINNRDIHVEVFSIDILRYISEGKIYKSQHIIIFEENAVREEIM